MANSSWSLGWKEGWNNIIIFLEAVKQAFVVILVLHIAIFVGFMYYHFDLHNTVIILKYYAALYAPFLWKFFSINGYVIDGIFYSQPEELVWALKPYMDVYLKQILESALHSALIWPVGIVISYSFSKRRATNQKKKKYVRGARLISVKELKREIRRNKENVDLPFGKIQMPVSAEPQHVMAIGSIGSGKTNFLNQNIERLQNRNERGIIYDQKGKLINRFYRPGIDHILNPFDKRSIIFEPLREVTKITDIDSIVGSLIPEGEGVTEEWNAYCRLLIAAIFHYCYQNKILSNPEVWKILKAPPEDISKFLKNTRFAEMGLRYVSDPGSRMTYSVLGVAMRYVKIFEYMPAGDAFSINEYLENGQGFIFISGYEDLQDSLSPILCLFIETLIKKILSPSYLSNKKFFLVLDEFGTLKQMKSVENFLKLSREKGGSAWLAIQDIGQIDDIYGHNLRKTIFGSCKTSIIFNCADPDTAEYLSRRIGDTEYDEMVESRSFGVKDYRDGSALTTQRRLEKLVIPAQIQHLNDLNAYVKFPNYDYVQTKFKYRVFPEKEMAFVEREDLDYQKIIAETARIETEVISITETAPDFEIKDNESNSKNKDLEHELDEREF